MNGRHITHIIRMYKAIKGRDSSREVHSDAIV